MDNNIPILADKNLISYCGFYCGACPKYIKLQCLGCKGDAPACGVGYKPCKVKPCCKGNDYDSCADCKIYKSVKHCSIYNPMIIRFGQFLTRTKRRKGIEMIKADGPDSFMNFMIDKKWVTVKIDK